MHQMTILSQLQGLNTILSIREEVQQRIINKLVYVQKCNVGNTALHPRPQVEIRAQPTEDLESLQASISTTLQAFWRQRGCDQI